MKMKQLTIRAAFPLVLAAALAACGDRDDEETVPKRSEMPRPVEPDGGIGDGAGPPAAPPIEAGNDTGMPELGIPEAIQGSWGLTPADCTSTRGDAKGLLRVSADTLAFYESLGRLGTIKDRADDRIRAEYAFTGEGMNWTRDVGLTLEQDGRTLIRREYGPEASPGAFKYTRCS
jgi:hypothetical protein